MDTAIEGIRNIEIATMETSNMKKRKVDVAVIGAGSAGMRAFKAASERTDNVVLIEGGEYGTSCARVGCMPSKLLIAAAETAYAVRQAPDFGINTRDINIDGVAVMDRVRRERDRFVGFVLDSIKRIPEQQRIVGRARFIDDHHIQVGEHTLINAKRIVIATGSRPGSPESFTKLGDRLVVNDDIFSWTDLPRSVAVFGPGVIGLELGQALRRLGVEVLMFGRSCHIGPLTDPSVMDTARHVFSQEFYLDADAMINRMERVKDGVALEYVDSDGQDHATVVDFVIAATGRVANVDELGLENTSLPIGAMGIPEYDPQTMQIGRSHVFIAGDVNNDVPVLHEAADEGDIAGDNAGRYPDIIRSIRRSPLTIIFTDPQITMVGSRYSELSEGSFIIGEASFADQGRSRIMLRNQGLLRIYANPDDGRFLGAEMFGPRAEHLGQ